MESMRLTSIVRWLDGGSQAVNISLPSLRQGAAERSGNRSRERGSVAEMLNVNLRVPEKYER